MLHRRTPVGFSCFLNKLASCMLPSYRAVIAQNQEADENKSFKKVLKSDLRKHRLHKLPNGITCNFYIDQGWIAQTFLLLCCKLNGKHLKNSKSMCNMF